MNVPSPQVHIQRWIQQAILHLASYLSAVGGADVLDDYGFLQGYLGPIRQQFPEIESLPELDVAFQQAIATHESGLPAEHLPLRRLSETGRVGRRRTRKRSFRTPGRG